jgi:hypothetical protein
MPGDTFVLHFPKNVDKFIVLHGNIINAQWLSLLFSQYYEVIAVRKDLYAANKSDGYLPKRAHKNVDKTNRI